MRRITMDDVRRVCKDLALFGVTVNPNVVITRKTVEYETHYANQHRDFETLGVAYDFLVGMLAGCEAMHRHQVDRVKADLLGRRPHVVVRLSQVFGGHPDVYSDTPGLVAVVNSRDSAKGHQIEVLEVSSLSEMEEYWREGTLDVLDSQGVATEVQE